MNQFLGREKELIGLKELLRKKTSSLVVLRGRRRIGKSTLAEEFAKSFPKHYTFTGLPLSKNPNAKAQYKEFRRQMTEQGIPSYDSTDWGDLFSILAKHTQREQVLIVLDEITWMGSKDPDFLGKLKIAWDLYFKKNPKLILILSGSNSAWIEKNILSSTGFMGRVSYRILLKELPLRICNKFWGAKKDLVSSYEKFKILALTGGVPRYLEEVLLDMTAEENISRLGFSNSGILFTEFDNIFSDLFNGRHQKYLSIVKCLANGRASLNQLAKKLKKLKGGDLSSSLKALEESGFLTRDHVWHIKNGQVSKLSQYRLCDNYLRFYLKYIEPNKNKIENQTFKGLPSSWLSIMGLQFENLVLNNLDRIISLLNIPANEITAASPYLQTQTKNRKKCQIDLLIQTKFNQLYICEIKFAKDMLGSDVIKEVQKKIDLLEYPKGFSCRPVLIHVNGVNDILLEKEYFSHIIDFSDLLQD
ncbi:MAG: hypothetical protein KR126chlam5_00836 [Candidatus Anoxychlamydiales bacterium]|nr:hypothetical protein [Candidatus Anoxychlamydiales bacterium]